MKAAPTVSVIIPCYNSARFIADAVESALGQTCQGLEILVVNDGSVDEFDAAIRPFRDRVRILDQENRGLAAARNRGIDETTAPFIAFLDADDRWHREKIERQISYLNRRPDCCLVSTRRRLIDEEGRPKASAAREHRLPPIEGDCLLQLVQGNRVFPSSVLLRRTTLGSTRFSLEVPGCEDWDLWLQLAPRGQFGCCDEELTDYRVHDHNMSRSQEFMLRSMLGVLDRALSREPSKPVRVAALRHRSALVIALAHFEYERGSFERSRELFQQDLTALRVPDIVRLLATYLPADVYQRSRVLWRVLRRIS